MKKYYLNCKTLKIKVKYFGMTFLISGCKHDTNLILVSIQTFFKVRGIKTVSTNHVTLMVDLETWSHFKKF